MPRQTHHGPTGVRLNPQQDARCRSAIQTTALLHRLNDFALQKPCRHTGQMFQMTDTQVRAALGLLRKTIPDLAVTELRGNPDQPLSISFEWAPATPVASETKQVADRTTIEADAEPVEIEWSSDETAKD